MNYKHIIKTIQLSIITSALMAGAAVANPNNAAESTDEIRAEAHMTSDQQASINAVTHNQALVQLEATGDVDQYIETNGQQKEKARTIPKCEDLAVPQGVKDSIHCE
ncbi:hypothetical protein BCT07_17385 [Vibrio breoganii]|uniref:hypothetical protein n=1 Tax=Vibrio breoganii TaxID=553239 RepID=UPI000C8252DC|nr:hypothetical protein [Vibrio breoganii]PMO34194.1 hypothetical protein BCT12_15060 [Vibrio breoganii]PMO53498.1 hypothetical protein BCT07_17385 [Vibrio breoganii]